MTTNLLSTLDKIYIVFHERTKYIEIDCHVVRNKVLAKIIRLIHVKTQCQLADHLTKALSLNQFSSLLSKMGIVNIHSPAAHLEGEYQDIESKKREQPKEKNEKNQIKCMLNYLQFFSYNYLFWLVTTCYTRDFIM